MVNKEFEQWYVEDFLGLTLNEWWNKRNNMNLFLKLRNIIVGHYRNLTGYSTDEVKRRRSICKSCEHNIKYMGSRICDQCGCIIKSKTAVESEKCLMNKW